jgi:serine/threonine-protein kinase
VLEGSVRRSRDELRVTVQLVNAKDGYHTWSHTYDRPMADIFQLQDEIAQAVLDSLRVVLTPQQADLLTSHGTSDSEVFDLYLRGRHLYQRMDADGLTKGIQYLRTVIERDPSFAAAYISLADALSIQAQITNDSPAVGKNSLEIRLELLDTALRLDPNNADAIATRVVELRDSLDLKGARREVERAERLAPNTALALRYLGQYYLGVGWPPEKGFAYMQRGQQLDPLNPWAILNLAVGYASLDKCDRALETLDRALELDPSFWVAWWGRAGCLIELNRNEEAVDAAGRALDLSHGYVDLNASLIVALAMAGRLDEARALFEEVDRRVQTPRWRPAFRAVALAAIGRHAEALDEIERAVHVGDGYITDGLDDRMFLPLHGNPRFDRIVAELGQERRIQRLRERLAATQ